MKLHVAGGSEYVSLSRARWLVAGRRARFLSPGEIEIFGSQPAARGPRLRWSSYSGCTGPESWQRGVRMMGAGLNAAIRPAEPKRQTARAGDGNRA